jgi:hypothetical protein
MPNVEICGVPQNGSDHQIVKKTVLSHLSKKELKDVVFSFHHVDVEDADGCDAPYVRISDTNKERAERIAGLLENIIDVEILVLTKFIPRKKGTLDKTRPI